MSACGVDLARAVQSIAEVFAAEGTDPLVDWTFPAVHLMHPLSRATIVPRPDGPGVGFGVSITRPLWVAVDAEEGAAVADAVSGLVGSDVVSFVAERAADGVLTASGYRVVEFAPGVAWRVALPAAHRELERSAGAALAVLVAAVRVRLPRVAPARALLLGQAFAVVVGLAAGDGPSEDRAVVAAVTRDGVTLRWGVEGLPVSLRLVGAEQLDVMTLVAGHDGRWDRDELDALRYVFATRAVGRRNLLVVDVPGELGHAIGVVSALPSDSDAQRLRLVLEDHLDLAREVAGPPRVGRVRA